MPYKPILTWRGQYLSRDPQKDGTCIIYYADSKIGFFEIYDEGGDYLLSYPRPLKLPADLFHDIESAKRKASDVLSLA